MEKKPSLSRPQRLLRSERWRPYIRFEKETGRWIAKAIKEARLDSKKTEGTKEKISSKIKVLMERDGMTDMDAIELYMYHDKKDDYTGIASDLRKEHIYEDLRSIDKWLNIQYQRLEDQDKRNKNINEFDLEIINEQSE